MGNELTELERGMIAVARVASFGKLTTKEFKKSNFTRLVRMDIFEHIGTIREGEWFTPYTQTIFIVYRTYEEYCLTELGYKIHQRDKA